MYLISPLCLVVIFLLDACINTILRIIVKSMNKASLAVIRPLAENLPADAAEQALRQFESRRNPAGLFHSAWSHVDYALCQSIDTDDDLRLNYLSYAQELLGEIIKADISGEIYGQAISHPISQDQLLGALTLSSYVPVFRQRALGEVTQRRDCVELYESLGQAMSYLRPLDIDEPPQWRMAEMAMLALSARTTQPDFLLYPASPREESAPLSRINHDSYFMSADSKVPLQQKLINTNKAYDECVTILTLEPLLDKGTSRAHFRQTSNRADKLNRLLSLVVAESTGETLEADEKCFLNMITQAVVAHRLAGEQVLVA